MQKVTNTRDWIPFKGAQLDIYVISICSCHFSSNHFITFNSNYWLGWGGGTPHPVLLTGGKKSRVSD